MKRLILCAVAVLLTAGALVVEPARACVVNPDCDDDYCYTNCRSRGYSTGACSWCTGKCVCG